MTCAPERIWAETDGENIIIHNGSDNLDALIKTGYLFEYIRADLVPQWNADDLAEAIRIVDGNHDLGAAALAEAIIAEMQKTKGTE
jgi:hypothetical protein